MRYKVFISYSHQDDEDLGAALQSALEQLAKPWNRRRALDTFRDQTDLSINPGLLPTILEALSQSEYLLLLASPSARQSKWVRKEIDYWTSHQPAKKLLIVLTDGELAWDDATSDFDWDRTNALPDDLRGYFADEPLWVDLRWARDSRATTLKDGKFRDAVATIAAELHGKPKRDIESEDLREHLKLQRLKRGALITVAVLLVSVSVASYFWIQQKHTALARRLASQSEDIRKNQPDLIELSVLLAAESMKRVPLIENDLALREALRVLPKPLIALKSPAFSVVDFNPDTRLAAAASEGDTVRVIDLRTGRDRLTLSKLRGPVSAVALSPDGSFLAVGCHGSIQVFNITSAEEVKHFDGLGNVLSLAVSENGSFLASGSSDKTTRVFTTAGWRQVLSLSHGDEVRTVSFSPDERYLITESTDTRVFDLANGSEILKRARASPCATAAVVTADFCVTMEFGGASLFDAKTGSELGALRGDNVKAVALSADGSRAAACSGMPGRDKTCRIFRPSAPPELLGELPPHRDVVAAITFNANGSYVATTGPDGTVRVFETDSLREFARIPGQDAHGAVRFSPDSFYVVTGAGTENGRIYALSSEELLEMPNQGRVTSVAFSEDGRYVAHAGRVQLLEIPDGREPLPSEELGRAIAVALSPNGKYLAIGGTNVPVRVLDVFDGKEVYRESRPGRIQALVFSSDNQLLASGGSGGTVWVNQLPGGNEVRQFDRLGVIRALAFSRDGTYLAAGTEKHMAQVFEMQNPKNSFSVVHQTDVHAVAFSPDGRYFASGSLDNVVRIFDMRSHKVSFSLPHEQSIFTIAFSPDSRLVATGGYDTTARVFDLSTHKELTRLNHPDKVRALLFSPDGRFLATAAGDTGDVVLSRHPLHPADLIDEACKHLTRNLRREESLLYLGDEPSSKTRTCPEIP